MKIWFGKFGIKDEDIAVDYVEFLEKHYTVGGIFDISKLPHPKDKILDALVRLNLNETTSDEPKEGIGGCVINLAHFQEGVGEDDLYQDGCDILKLSKDLASGKIDTMAYFNEFSGSKEKRERWKKFDNLVNKEKDDLYEKFYVGTAKVLAEKYSS